jgi:hypothetical protein
MYRPPWRAATGAPRRRLDAPSCPHRDPPLEIVRGGPRVPLLNLCASSLRGLGGRLAEQMARNVDQCEPSSFLRQFSTVGLKEYLDSLFAGMNFHSERRALEIDFVTPPGFAANDCVGHLHSCERLRGQSGVMASLRYLPEAFASAATERGLADIDASRSRTNYQTLGKQR